MSTPEFFLGRQPIVGRQRELQAYELLFRSSGVNRADVFDDLQASAAVIQHAFSDLGVQSVLGDKLGFINVSEPLLMSDVLEVLPRQQVVLEVLETVHLTPEVIARLKTLKAAGYRLALDDVIGFERAYLEVLPLVQFVKLDILAMSEANIEPLVKALRKFNVQLLAEKIDSPAQRDFCQALGFDLFQGYHFAKPTILSGRPVKPSSMQLLKLLSQVSADADTSALENTLKQAPDLMVQLLKLVNTASYGLSRKISSVGTAITLLGRAQLHRWVQVMVFAQQSDGKSVADPLVQTASVRGRFMENLANMVARGDSAIAERAFMVGMLSLMDALFNQPLESILQPLNLEESVMDALLHRRGLLGDLLQLTESAESGDEVLAASLMGKFCGLTLDEINRGQIEALAWAGKLGQDTAA